MEGSYRHRLSLLCYLLACVIIGAGACADSKPGDESAIPSGAATAGSTATPKTSAADNAPANASPDKASAKPAAAGGGPDKVDKADPALTTLTWMGHWKDEHKREDLVREVAQKFEFQHPHVKVDLVFTEDIIGYKSHADTAKYIVKMIQSGTVEWDVIWLDHSIYQEIAIILDDPAWGKEHLVDFANIPGFAESHKDFITADSSYRERLGGVLVGPYLEGFISALYYNRDVAQKLGVEIPQFGFTYGDLVEVLKTLYAYNQKHGTNIYAFLDAHDRPMLSYIFDRLVKCEIQDFNQVRSPVASKAKLAALKKAFDAFEELSQYQPLSPEHIEQKWYDTRDLILDDKLLFYNDGTWMYSHWMTLGPEKIDKIVPVESVTYDSKCGHYIGSYIPTWGVLKNAPNRDLAIKLLTFWASPEFAEGWVRYTKNPTGLKGNFIEATMGDDPFTSFQSQIIERYGDRLDRSNLATITLGEQNSLLNAQIELLTRQVMLREKTAEHAYQELISAAKGLDDLIE